MRQIKQFRHSYKTEHKGVNLMINAGIGILKLTVICVGSMTTYRLPCRWCMCALCRGAQHAWGDVWWEREADVVKLISKSNIWRKSWLNAVSIEHKSSSNRNGSVTKSQQQLGICWSQNLVLLQPMGCVTCSLSSHVLCWQLLGADLMRFWSSTCQTFIWAVLHTIIKPSNHKEKCPDVFPLTSNTQWILSSHTIEIMIEKEDKVRKEAWRADRY